MNRLLSVNFARLKKNKLFWIGFIGMFAFGAGMSLTSYFRGQQAGYQPAIINDVFFFHVNVIGFVAAAFCSLFLSTEYREGAIRNKLIVGHTRASVYLSNLIVNSVAILMMNISYTLAVCIVGLPLLGNFVGIDTIVVLKLFGINILATLSYTALFTLIGMINQNNAMVTIISVLIALVLLFVSPLINEKLLEPKVNAAVEGVPGTNEMRIVSEEPNPYYIDGAKRSLYQFLEDFLPSGQFMQIIKNTETGREEDIAPEILLGIIELKEPNYIKVSAYSLLLITVTTGIGIFVFGKRDLK